MNILVIGSGGREHAICHSLKKSRHNPHIYCAPGNAGIAQIARLVPIPVMDFEKIAEFSISKKTDLVVVAPDDPLAAGLVDYLRERGVKAFGPDKAAARIESSKVFAKQLMVKYGIPTAKYESFDEPGAAKDYLKTQNFPKVIKADGLALGKGVLICENLESGLAAIKTIMEDRQFGAAGETIVIEEFLTGRELSMLAFCDGSHYKLMRSAQDHKRALDGDKGLNTGGMGTFSPSPYYTKAVHEYCESHIYQKTLDAMITEGCPFTGVLYFGLILTTDGPKVLEYNARFGDPEAQVVLPALKTDLVDIMNACIDGTLDKMPVEFASDAAVCVVMASGGYPKRYETGKEIIGLDSLAKREDVLVFHAGTKSGVVNGRDCILTAGGRVLGLTGIGHDLAQAKAKAYEALSRVSFENAHYRTDIGASL